MATILPPDLPALLGSLLPALPAAALSTRPPDSVLELLSPILRQRVQLLAASATAEPPSPPSSQQQQSTPISAATSSQSNDDTWIKLLCYSPARALQLQATAKSAALELHPVSGEVEVDWDHDAAVRYQRLDEETLQCLVVLARMGLGFRLVYCTDGWRVGEVTVVDDSSDNDGQFAAAFGFGGSHSLQEAEAESEKSKTGGTASSTAPVASQPSKHTQSQPQPPQLQLNSSTNTKATENNNNNDDDDDDDYWARYDTATSTQATPQPPRTPAANTSHGGGHFSGLGRGNEDEDDYYAQYDTVQPAMDNHDPDEEMDLPHDTEAGQSSFGGYQQRQQEQLQHQTDALPVLQARQDVKQPEPESEMVHPKPSRSNSSAGSTTSVQKLEAVAQRLEQSEFGVKQHISRSMKSLYMLARASGVDLQEFDRLVRIELDMLPMMDEIE
ncbi:hypothetical protein MN608_04734 [Microdochium nivale]|nr:hypothetical protein MN608_04734 [Microdochium nivale]